MKERIYILLACWVFIAATGFAFQSQQETSRASKAHKTSKAEQRLMRELEDTKKELEALRQESDADKRKRDSVDAERAVNLDITQKAVIDLRMSNKALRTVSARLAYIVSKMNPDTAMKYYGQFDEIAPRDSLKKNLSYPEVTPKLPKKRGFFYRLFHK